MSDLRVDVSSISRRYLSRSDAAEVWNVTPVWHSKTRDADLLLAGSTAASRAQRVVDGLVGIFEARTMQQHHDAVEIFEQELLWDSPIIKISNKGHLRMAAYLLKYIDSVHIIPLSIISTELGAGRTLVELDAVIVAKNVHFKLGVNGSLATGKVELLTARLTNLPPLLASPLRTAVGVALGALPHALEGVLGYVFDAADGADYYAREREAAFDARHPGSTNPTWDWVQDLAYDVPAWAKEHTLVAAETLQALFGKSWNSVHEVLSAIIAYYSWLFNAAWATFSGAMAAVGDMLGTTAVDTTEPQSPPMPGTARGAGGPGTMTGGAAKVYKGPPVTGMGEKTAMSGSAS